MDMQKQRSDMNRTILGISMFFSCMLLLAAVAAAAYMGETAEQVIAEWVTILTSPCPLVTDYFKLGSLAASFLNAGVCGMACAAMMLLPGTRFRATNWAGYFLVIAHCFYGLNFVNMWPPILGFYIYCHVFSKRLRENLDWAMFITSFSPFMSELLFRYPMPVEVVWTIGPFSVNPIAIGMCLALSVFVGFTLPAMLPGTAKLHRGFNLYNGGLATGLLGLFIYAFLFKTMGVIPSAPLEMTNEVYTARGESYLIFGTGFYALVFGACVLAGWWLNGRSFRGYGALLQDSGYKADFIRDYGAGLTLVNLGLYGLMMTAYFDAVILLTNGAGFTGATCGIILAAMTFAANGQHPKNVWPILVGYALLSVLVHAECTIAHREIPWTLSTQGYMNGIAFATGLCPFSGKYGWKIGVLAGFVGAVMCTTTSVMHGGFVLYNGGLTAGIAALIVLPLLDKYMQNEGNVGQN